MESKSQGKTPRASNLYTPRTQNANPNKNGHGSNQAQLPYDNNGCKHVLDETNMSNFSLNLRALFCTSTFTLGFLIAFLDVHNKELNVIPLRYVYYTCELMPQ